MTKIMPWLTGSACLFYIFGWIEGITYPAWTPLLWCFGCFMNDLHNAMEAR